MRLNEVAYSPDIVWVSYGTDHYDPAKFKPIDYDDPGAILNNKPWGGLWASPENSKHGWIDFCRNEDFLTHTLDKSFRFKLTPNAKIYVIDNERDLINISTSLKLAYMIGQGYYVIDFDRLLNEGYDGIYVTDRGILYRYYHGPNHNIVGLSSWDVESICVFRPDVVVPIEDNDTGVIKINESDLRRVVKNSLNKLLNEIL